MPTLIFENGTGGQTATKTGSGGVRGLLAVSGDTANVEAAAAVQTQPGQFLSLDLLPAHHMVARRQWRPYQACITPKEGTSSGVCHHRQDVDFEKVGQRTPHAVAPTVTRCTMAHLYQRGYVRYLPEGKVGGLQARVGADSILDAWILYLPQGLVWSMLPKPKVEAR